MNGGLRLLLISCLAAFLLSCGQSNRTELSGSAGSTNGPANPQGFSGRLLTQPLMFIPDQGFATVREQRKTIEERGLFVAPDGSLVFWPPAPAALWTVEVGNQRVRLNNQGEFFLPSLPAGVTSGTFTHPTDSRIVLTFPLDQLSPGPMPEKSLVYPIAFPGACGMSEREDEFCTGIPAIPVPKKDEDEAGEIRPRFGPEPTQVVERERGTYPNGPKTKICEDKNGIFRFLPTIPKFDAYIKYIGSTCDGYVMVGACINENPTADLEYRLLLESRTAIGAEFFRELIGTNFYLSPPPVPGLDIDCQDNHKGRECQEVKIDDLSVDLTARKKIVKVDDGSVTVFVKPGSSEPLTVHNNGAFGFTFVSFPEQRIVGRLSGEGYKTDTPNPQLQPKPPQVPTNRVEHFRPISPISVAILRYEPDQDLVYEIPADAKPGSRDTVVFSTDRVSISVTFVVEGESSEPSPPVDLIDDPPRTVSVEHFIGITDCPQVLQTLFFSNKSSDETVNVTVTSDSPHLQADPGTFTLAPLGSGGSTSQLVRLLFVCSTQTSFTAQVTVRATTASGKVEQHTINVSVSIQ